MLDMTMRVHHARKYRLYLLVVALLLTVYYYNNGDYDFHRIKNVFVLNDKAGHHMAQLAKQKYNVIRLIDQHTVSYTLEGYSFDRPEHSTKIAGKVSIAFLHSFSPQVKKEAAEKFVQPWKLSPVGIGGPHPVNNQTEYVFSIMSPALHWFNGSLLLICRIWMYEAHRASGFMFTNDYFYMQTYDETLQPKSGSHLLGIPSKLPQDPRLYQVQNKLFASFSSKVTFPDGTHVHGKERIRISFYDIENDRTYLTSVENRMSYIKAERNWVPFVVDEKLYMVQLLEPLSILSCTVKGECSYVYQENSTCATIRLRGGTPFEHYDQGYYISLAHSVSIYPYDPKASHLGIRKYYSVHLVVLTVSPFAQLVYVSKSVKIPNEIYARNPIPNVIKHQYIDHDFYFPVSLILESKDSAVIGAHVNDNDSILIRMRGLQKLMDQIIKHGNGNKMEPHACAYGNSIHKHLKQETGLQLL